MKKRPTIRDIAARADCHYSTVSLALRDHPKIPRKTRDLIHRIAQELNYRPDPMLSALTAYRRETQRSDDFSTLAWITNFSSKEGWKACHISREYYRGAKREAESRGYQLEEFWLQEGG